MLDIILLILKQLLEIITYVLIIWGILQCKFKKEKFIYIIAGGIFLMASATIIIFNLYENMDFFYVPIDIAFILVAFEGKIKRKIIYFFVAFINAAVINMLIISVLDLIPGVDNRWLLDSREGSLIYFSICGLIILVIIFALRKYKKRIEDWINGVPLYYFIFMLIPILCCDLLMVFLQYREEFSKTDLNKLVTLSVIFLAFFLIGWSVIFISVNASKKYHKIQNILNTKYMEIQKNNYERILENDSEIRKFRHDIKAQMACMQMFLKDRRFNELETYLNDVRGEIDRISNIKLKSGNEVVDAIINHMDSEASKSDIILNLYGEIPSDLKISQYDLCTIFYNSIQNAIDACKKIKDDTPKVIKINLKIHKDVLHITVENPIDKLLKNKISIYNTSKNDKINHGFGIGNLKNAVNKYSGDVKFTSENDKFAVSILLYEIV